MKNKKIKIIATSILCAGIVSAASFAVMANGNDRFNNQTVKSNLSGILQRMNSESDTADGEESRRFIIDGKISEGFTLPEKAGEWYTFKSDSEHRGFSFGIGIGGIKGHFGSGDISSANIADILGISEEELEAKLEEADGNILKILEDTGKLDEYKAKLLENCKSKLDAQVASGTITQEKADEAMARLEEAIDNFSSDGILKMPRDGSSKIGEIKDNFGFGDISSANIADILGISEEELEAKLEEADGNILKILEDTGKLDEYKAKLLENCKSRLDAQVASGMITQEKADEAMARLEEAIDNFSSDDILKMPRGRHTKEFKDSEEFEKSTGEKRLNPHQTSGV